MGRLALQWASGKIAMFLAPALIPVIGLAQVNGIIHDDTSTGLVCALAAASVWNIAASMRLGALKALKVLEKPALATMLLAPGCWCSWCRPLWAGSPIRPGRAPEPR